MDVTLDSRAIDRAAFKVSWHLDGVIMKLHGVIVKLHGVFTKLDTIIT